MNNNNGIIVNIKGKDIRVEYSIEDLHVLALYDRPFKAIQRGNKKVEARTNTPNSPFNFDIVKIGDKIRFINTETGETVLTRVIGIRKYKSAREYLETEGLENCSSGTKDINEAVRGIEALTDYKENIEKNGLFAIEIDLII